MVVLRKYLSVFFLLLMVLNTAGYYAFLVILRDHTAQASVRKIQSNINEPGGNMIIKVPLALPYAGNSEEYVSAAGDFTYEGKVYQIMKQRFYNDTLYIVCVHDYNTTEADKKIDGYTQSFSGCDQEHSSCFELNTFFTKYDIPAQYAIRSYNAGWVMDFKYTTLSYCYKEFYKPTIFRPPQFFS